MDFKNVCDDDIEFLNSFYKNCSYHLCEYSSGVKIMWKNYYNSAYTISNGCLVVKECVDGMTWFNYPVPSENGDIEKALDDIDSYCSAHAIKPIFSTIPEALIPSVVKRYPHITVTRPRLWYDYFYLTENFRTFAGRKFSGQRNHINKFRKLYPDAVFRELTAEDDSLLDEFWSEYEKLFSKNTKIAQKELVSAKHIVSLRKHYRSACMTHNGKIIGFALGEKCGDMMVIHVEKALYTYEGVYPAIVQEFANLCCADVVYSNREDDAGDKGLRTSKMQYRPTELRHKYKISVGTEADQLTKIPTLTSDRLTLNAITDDDTDAYSAICLNDELNKYWGYDYRKDLKGELTDSYFVDVAKHDFEIRLAINFAVRLNGEFIGEVVVYNFDFKGGVEIGCRIAPEYAGKGYGTEAFSRVAEWVLYEFGMEKAVAKCFKENAPSFKMLSSCMTKSGEDEKFFYFEKKI